MTEDQDEALCDYVDTVTEPFTMDDLVSYLRMADPKNRRGLRQEAQAFLEAGRLAFRRPDKKWITRRGYFEEAVFVITPTKLELLNGILIPGHRCVPFANPELAPQEYKFYWQGQPIPGTTSEGEPEDFYPFYSLLGEEYASQYVAKDNPENEDAYNSDPFEDPPEVSINVMDMRRIYMEAAFIPGDRFAVTARDWLKGEFNLEKIEKDEWSEEDLAPWLEAAEAGFRKVFELLGPGNSTEEQIACACWYAGARMLTVPAYSLEEFLYEKTESIEVTPYGIESRFWYAGREIPDRKGLDPSQVRPDRTPLEVFLCEKGIPISEYVIHAYIWDAMFRGETKVTQELLYRIAPKAVGLSVREYGRLIPYSASIMRELIRNYNPRKDTVIGPIRQRAAEVHTAVVELAARLERGGIDPVWLPKHTYIVLSQIQIHASCLLEDLDINEPPSKAELENLDTSLDSMIETYEDIKKLIEEGLNGFRRNKFVVIKSGEKNGPSERVVQISIGGTEVWRRLVVHDSCRLQELHAYIQAALGWNSCRSYQFTAGVPQAGKKAQALDLRATVGDLAGGSATELLYEYGNQWTVRIMFLSAQGEAPGEGVRCVAGANAAPPETVGGPLRFRRFLAALETRSEGERAIAQKELGADFKADKFDAAECNKRLRSCVV